LPNFEKFFRYSIHLIVTDPLGTTPTSEKYYISAYIYLRIRIRAPLVPGETKFILWVQPPTLLRENIWGNTTGVDRILFHGATTHPIKFHTLPTPSHGEYIYSLPRGE
jgi:hypothetical protein